MIRRSAFVRVSLRGALAVLACVAPFPLRAQGGAPAVASRGAPEAEALAVVDALFDGMRRADSTAVRALFHAKARLISASVRNGTPVLEVEETVDDFVQAVGRARTAVWDERTFNPRVLIDGPLASVWVEYTFYVDATLSHCGVDHVLLVRQDSAWKIVELADTRRREGCTARPEAEARPGAEGS